MKVSSGSILLGVAVAAVVTAAVSGLVLLGPISEERALRVDARRVTDLQAISTATNLYWTRHSKLPPSLFELSQEPGVRIRIADPVDRELYGYQPSDSIQYSLCATFEEKTREFTRNAERSFWSHSGGRQCFDLEARKIRGAADRNPAPTTDTLPQFTDEERP